MRKGKAPIYKLSHRKHPELSKFANTDMQETQWTFFYCTTRASTLSLAIILLT